MFVNTFTFYIYEVIFFECVSTCFLSVVINDSFFKLMIMHTYNFVIIIHFTLSLVFCEAAYFSILIQVFLLVGNLSTIIICPYLFPAIQIFHY